MQNALSSIAKKLRGDILQMIFLAQSGHPGGSLSIVEIITALFYSVLNNTEHLHIPDRDRFILSKGHGVPALYACFADKGLIDPLELKTLRQLGSRLQGHPDKIRLPLIEASTGSLGQGLSIAQGIALGNKGTKSRIFCLIGDGEMQEGQIWEAFLSASKFQLSHLCVILDYNQSQIDGPVASVMPIEPIAEKLRAFGWKVSEVNGHDIPSLIHTLKAFDTQRPHFIIAHTIKGKGVSFMEHNPQWHGTAPNATQLAIALQEIQEHA